MLLLRTPSGSRLYNTMTRPDADYDWYEVYEGKGRTTQTFEGEDDRVRMSLDNFMTRAGKGSPQALEAMWSREAFIDNMPWRWNFHPNVAQTVETYRRTIKSFWLSGDPKRMLHAHRLEYNLTDFLDSGRFNPTLTDGTVALLRAMVEDNWAPSCLREDSNGE